MGKWNTTSPPTAVHGDDPVAYLYFNNGTPASPSYACNGEPLANPWILVLLGTARSKQFICPSDPTSPTQAKIINPDPFVADTYLNFARSSFSYSFAYPWVSPTAPVAVWWRGGADGSAVIAADIGPSLSLPLYDPNALPGKRAGNSANHGGIGQQILLADSHVEFSKTNIFGRNDDNIYSANHGSIVVKAGGAQLTSAVGLNTDSSDIVLTPARP
jgi:hypothetical protein